MVTTTRPVRYTVSTVSASKTHLNQLKFELVSNFIASLAIAAHPCAAGFDMSCSKIALLNAGACATLME
jgi:hypothetical protein